MLLVHFDVWLAVTVLNYVHNKIIDNLLLFDGIDIQEYAPKEIMHIAKTSEKIGIIVGCEGGFSAKEAEKINQAGIKSVGLGKRILRCETAPLCALSAIMYDSGEF